MGKPILAEFPTRSIPGELNIDFDVKLI